MSLETCYMCDRVATTVEHCPPQVFFPEEKDVGGNYRVDLITVPSCAEHNTSKSKDDEYVAYLMCCCYGASDLAYEQARTKMRRALEGRLGLQSRLLKNLQDAVVNGEDGVRFDADHGAFSKVMVHTARGLYFKQTGKKVVIPLEARSPSLRRADDKDEDWINLFQMSQNLTWQLGDGCSNPDVFSFRLVANLPFFHFLFYGGIGVFVGPAKAGL